MAAINLDTVKVAAGTDVSFPAFWLPFQDLGTNNHLGQWAQQSFNGACSADADCNTGGASGRCCYTGACAACVAPPPPPPQCVATPDCAPGQCCEKNTCVACGSPPPDGGPPPPPPDGSTTGCNTCLDCNGQACINHTCGGCTDSTQCCAPLSCVQGMCVLLPP
jgi:hypothetical protein